MPRGTYKRKNAATPLPELSSPLTPVGESASGTLTDAIEAQADTLYGEDCRGKFSEAPQWVQDEYRSRARKMFLELLGVPR